MPNIDPAAYAALPLEQQYELAAIELEIEEINRVAEKREQCYRSFRAFVEYFWPRVDPAPYRATWVTDAICDHLQAVRDSEIRRLLINVHFRSAKTTIMGVLFPPWSWVREPSESILYLSHTSRRALSASDHSRDLMRSAEFMSMFGDKFILIKDTAGLIENDHRGSRTTLSAESAVTGEGGNLNLFDDPNDVQEVESQTERDKTNNRFDNLSTRSNDFSKARWVVNQQRTHKNDVTGHIKSLGGLGFEELIIPLEYQGKKYVTSLGFSDPRKKLGDVTDDARFPGEEIERLKLTLGYRYSGQANQNPETPQGNIIKREWFPPTNDFVYKSEDNETRLSLYWDLGGSSSPDSDSTVGTVLYRTAGEPRDPNAKYVILWQHAGQWDAFDRDNEIESFCKKWDALYPGIPIILEATFGLAKDVAPDINNRLIDCGLNSRLDWARKRKFARCEPVIAAAKAGRFGCYVGPLKGFDAPRSWIVPMLNQFAQLKVRETAQGPEFYDDHDDRIDSLAGAFDTLVHSAL